MDFSLLFDVIEHLIYIWYWFWVRYLNFATFQTIYLRVMYWDFPVYSDDDTWTHRLLFLRLWTLVFPWLVDFDSALHMLMLLCTLGPASIYVVAEALVRRWHQSLNFQVMNVRRQYGKGRKAGQHILFYACTWIKMIRRLVSNKICAEVSCFLH
jgi:hypothetical protein